MVLRTLLKLVFIFTSSLFLHSELVTILFWVFSLDSVFALAELLKALNTKKFLAFQQIYQIVWALALPVLGSVLDLPRSNHYALFGSALGIMMGVHALAQLSEVVALGLGEIRATTTQASYKNKLA